MKVIWAKIIIPFLCIAQFDGNQDHAIAIAIRQEFTNVESMELHFPNSVKRYYKQRGFKPSWITPTGIAEQTWDAMLLFDCVAHYGLLHTDYHPRQLLYERLDSFMELPSPANAWEKARFDIALTDALLTFMNHLHYGRRNPHYPAGKIDSGKTDTFDAVVTLATALRKEDFMDAITGVQPTSTEYRALLETMKLITGQYVGDCYEVPKGVVRKLAINMERLRWLNCDGDTYIHINVPAYTLMLHRSDSDYLFRVIVGKPTTPTPLIQGHVDYFYTVPTGIDHSIGKIIFRINDPSGTYLYDTPNQRSFQQSDKAVTDGNIQVEQATKLAALLLETDGASAEIPSLQAAMTLYERHTFALKKPIPIYITYLTCEIKSGLLETYTDLYGWDAALEAAFYN